MKKLKQLRFKITHQGAHKINCAVICAEGGRVKAVVMDMDTKRGEIFSTRSDDFIPNITIGPTEDMVKAIKNKETELTEITFPDLKGWNIFCASISKYNISICFIKD